MKAPTRYADRCDAVLAQLAKGPQLFRELHANMARTAPIGAQTLIDVLDDLMAEKTVLRRHRPTSMAGVQPFEYYLPS
jgi:DNA-binding HxlR family transcriptional regulator